MKPSLLGFYKFLKESGINCSWVVKEMPLHKLRVKFNSLYQAYLRKYFVHQYLTTKILCNM